MRQSSLLEMLPSHSCRHPGSRCTGAEPSLLWGFSSRVLLPRTAEFGMSFVYLSRFFKLLSLFVNALAVFCQSSLQSTEPGDALQPHGGHREGRVIWAEISYCSPHRCHQGALCSTQKGGCGHKLPLAGSIPSILSLWFNSAK